MRKSRAELEEQEAEEYAWAIRAAATGMVRPDWSAKNADIIDRFSRTALIRIKRRAWQLVEARESTDD